MIAYFDANLDENVSVTAQQLPRMPVLIILAIHLKVVKYNLGLGNVNALAGHEASMHHENKSKRMEFQGGACEPGSQRQILQNPPLGDEVRHDRVKTKTCGNRRALKVLALSSRVLGES